MDSSPFRAHILEAGDSDQKRNCSLPACVVDDPSRFRAALFKWGSCEIAGSDSIGLGWGPRSCISVVCHVLLLLASVTSQVEASSPLCFLFGLFISVCGVT